MRDVTAIDPEWLPELAPHFYRHVNKSGNERRRRGVGLLAGEGRRGARTAGDAGWKKSRVMKNVVGRSTTTTRGPQLTARTLSRTSGAFEVEMGDMPWDDARGAEDWSVPARRATFKRSAAATPRASARATSRRETR